MRPSNTIEQGSECTGHLHFHRAPEPAPVDEPPLPNEHPVPQQDPVPSPHPERQWVSSRVF